MAVLYLSLPVPRYPIIKHESETNHRDDESPLHGRTVGDISHEHRAQRPAHNGHDKKGRGFSGERSEAFQSEYEYRREHDGHEEVGDEK